MRLFVLFDRENDGSLVPLGIGDELNVLLHRSFLTAILSGPPRSGGFMCCAFCS